MSSSAPRDTARLDADLRSIQRRAFGTDERSVPEHVTPSPGQTPRHVGIIGAGVAGLRCADILLQHGFQVTVLEGRHRLGGRLHQALTTPIADGVPLRDGVHGRFTVDMGPNWIHGTVDNPILDLVRATGTATSSHSVDEDGKDLGGAVFADDGSLLDQEDGDALSTMMWTIVEEAFAHSSAHCATIDPGESLLDYFQQRLDVHLAANASLDASLDAAALQRRRTLVLQMAEFWGHFVGSGVASQSLKYFWLESCIEGENLFCAGTFGRVLARLCDPVVRGAAVHYDTVVSRITTHDTTHDDDNDDEHAGVTVATASGQTFHFDDVVCTTPLGWLKKNTAAFVPPLPDRLLEAIDSLGYGCLEKVYIAFPEAFWQSPSSETGRSVRGLFQWLAPGVYAQHANPDAWPIEAFDMAALPGATSTPMLLFYLFGEQSRHITGTLKQLAGQSDSTNKTTATTTAEDAPLEPTVCNAKQVAFLIDYFEPYFSKLPHYDAAAPACKPSGVLATDWLGDDLAGNGSYANFQVGLAAGDDDVHALREGLPERRLWLAGEHTAPFVALGTATGAYWSGESVGRRMVAKYMWTVNN